MVLSLKLHCTQVEATIIIISECPYRHAKTQTSKLETPRRPFLGANNQPLDVVGEREVTHQMGGGQSAAQGASVSQVLIGVDFLMAHKCITTLTFRLSIGKKVPVNDDWWP